VFVHLIEWLWWDREDGEDGSICTGVDGMSWGHWAHPRLVYPFPGFLLIISGFIANIRVLTVAVVQFMEVFYMLPMAKPCSTQPVSTRLCLNTQFCNFAPDKQVKVPIRTLSP
jgi:hypothetical protein